MILTIDIGNTNILLGCFKGNELVFRERISSKREATDLEYAAMIKTALDMYTLTPQQIDGAIMASVVPTITNTLKRAIEKLIGIETLVVGPGIKSGLSIRIDNPAQLSAPCRSIRCRRSSSIWEQPRHFPSSTNTASMWAV